jgi:3-oxoacyl-[acyl-carrier-protein] synthase II
MVRIKILKGIFKINREKNMSDKTRVVITGIGLTCPNGNNVEDFRKSLLENKSLIQKTEVEGIGLVPIGLCDFDEEKYQHKKMIKRGTRAGSIGVYCANEALNNAGISLDDDLYKRENIGTYIGTTEHGVIETESEFERFIKNERKTTLWSHHQNPRVISNAPAGEITLNLKISGPHYTLGGACAAGNIALIHGAQMLKLREVDLALCGGVSETPRGLSFFASFNAQGALSLNPEPAEACKPLDEARDGIIISEGGGVFCLERLENAIERKANIWGEVVGYSINSDATDFVNPNSDRQKECIYKALEKANLKASEIDIVNLHATGTNAGDASEFQAVSDVFKGCENTYINCTKGFIGHCMGAAGAIELAGNLPSFYDNKIHGSKNTRNLDKRFENHNIVKDGELIEKEVKTILNISFGMLGINSCVIVKKYEE